MSINIKNITTEGRNELTRGIDQLSSLEIVRLINNEDKTVPLSVESALDQVAALVDAIVEKLRLGGRLIYMGAGTSGRIGLLDAVECPPTYGVSDEQVMCLLAGGKDAFSKAVEGAEDSKTLAIEDLDFVNVTDKDVIVGIAASGRTPYVISGIEYAKSKGCVTGCIVNAKNSIMATLVDYPVEAVTGSEVISGSTRMKSGTAQKLICNMISTATMVRLGHVYKNLMIDLKATNEKLVARQLGIIAEVCECDTQHANELLQKYGTVKKVIFAYLSNIECPKQVEEILARNDNHIQKALKEIK